NLPLQVTAAHRRLCVEHVFAQCNGVAPTRDLRWRLSWLDAHMHSRLAAPLEARALPFQDRRTSLFFAPHRSNFAILIQAQICFGFPLKLRTKMATRLPGLAAGVDVNDHRDRAVEANSKRVQLRNEGVAFHGVVNVRDQVSNAVDDDRM